YAFDRKGQATKNTDSAGNEWINEYDAKGRLWRTTDPDKGTTTSAFYDDNSLQKTVDARGEALWYVYDQLGRQTQLRDDSATGRLRSEWKYDTLYGELNTRFKGQLTQKIRYDYDSAGTASAYKWRVGNFNERYQPTGVDYVIPPVETGLNQTYGFGYGYSPYTGAPTKIAYPGGGGLVNEQLTTDYDATTGMPVRLDTSLTGFVGTLATASYTAYGERSGSIYKVPGSSNFTQETIYRDEATRRVNRTIIERSTVAGTVSDRRYSYQDAGTIEAITDTPQVGEADTQCFRDDALGRLTTAWTPRTGVSCDTDPTVANLGGPAPYWQDWTFTDTGSRRTETSHDSSGNTTRSYSVPEGGPGAVQPHAVTNMNTVTPTKGIVNHKYTYDNTGNTTCRPGNVLPNNCASGTNSQILDWDAEGKLATVSAAGKTIETNLYDTDGVRLIRRDATGTTLYLPDQEIRFQDGVTTGTRYYDFAGTTIASRTASSAVTDLTWLYSDHQGTQQIAINAGTQQVDIRRQTPYGTPRGTNPTWPNNKSFVGGDTDPTGLINIGARQYDKTLGRFISVDPLMDLADPQQWNGYTYANNTPVTSSDPTGLIPLDCLTQYSCPDYRPGDEKGNRKNKAKNSECWPRCSGSKKLTPPVKRIKPFSGSCDKNPTVPCGDSEGGRYVDDLGGIGMFADQIISAAGRAGIDPRLLLAIILNESRIFYKYAAGWRLESDFLKSVWWRTTGKWKNDLGPSIGIGQMKEGTFKAVQDRHSELSGSEWSNLKDDDDLAFLATAFLLSDLGKMLPDGDIVNASGTFSRNQMAAYGYNAGDVSMESAARGASMEMVYVSKFNQNYARADNLFCGSGYFVCS
ncbi:RHS repeat-associated core domain-containing protein, partial [Micromonospora violae]|uniref:RHS repeat-associated core domain-containing protein n=1 Tax=Micromonospora violae TaxID=1278207 RepID=UPI00340D65E2